MNCFPIILAFWAIFAPAAMIAETPEGANDPAFQQAVEIWLSDDDASSLPMLAKLARAGNVAAQILLGQIEWEGKYSSLWSETLSRKEHREVFRDPTGMFGKRWLKVAAERSELARMFEAAHDFQGMQSVVPKLYELGEFRAIDQIISVLYNSGQWDALVELESKGVLPPEYLSTAWYAAIRAQFGAGSDEAMRLMHEIVAMVRETDQELATHLSLGTDFLAELEPGAPENVTPLMELAAEDRRYFASYTAARLREVHDGKQIAAVCRTICPAQQESCVAASRLGSGLFVSRPILGSPVASLIPPKVYARSQRAIGELLREHLRYSDFYPNPGDYIKKLAEKSRCLADHVNTAMEQ